MTNEYGQMESVGLVGHLPEVNALISKVAPTNATVLITGESGTGKELVAKKIHQISRPHYPFVVVDCGAIPENLVESELFGHVKGAYTGAHKDRTGKFEQADGGTIFLDEIGDLGLDIQVKLLRVLQDGEYTAVGSNDNKKTRARVITATHRNLTEMLNGGRFRQDLYYRINVFPIDVPPLRKRRGDINDLIIYFVQKYAVQDLGMDSDNIAIGLGGNLPKDNKKDHSILIDTKATKIIQHYDWPGNVRELEHAVEHALIMAYPHPDSSQGSTITITYDELPDSIKKQSIFPKIESAADVLQYMIQGKLSEADLIRELTLTAKDRGGNYARAAELLGVSRATVRSRCKTHTTDVKT